jgi:NADPH:quinone reductase
MRTWRQHRLGEPREVLQLDDVEPPEPAAGQVLIQVAACALNFPDALYCRGQYQERPELPFAPGLEVSGRVLAVGDGVTHVGPGQRVVALPVKPWGGLAERCLASEGTTFPIPDSFEDAPAAALPITYQTGWFGLFHRASLQPGETVLVHAGAGGVGSAAIQLALAGGATVIATAGGAEKVERCRRLGAHVAVDYTADDFVEAVKAITGGRGADVIYDPVGGDVFDRSRKVIAWEGRILVIGFTSGRIATLPTNHALLKNYSVVGVHWAMYSRRDPALVRRCHQELLELHAARKVAPLVKQVVPFEHAPEAIEAIASRSTWGKVVVAPPK